jgi:hypothetical protein
LLWKKQPRKLIQLKIDSLTINNIRDIENLLKTAGRASNNQPSSLIQLELYGRAAGFPSNTESALLRVINVKHDILQFVHFGVNNNVEGILVDMNKLDDANCFVFGADEFEHFEIKMKIAAQSHRLCIPITLETFEFESSCFTTVDLDFEFEKGQRTRSNNQITNSILLSFGIYSTEQQEMLENHAQDQLEASRCKPVRGDDFSSFVKTIYGSVAFRNKKLDSRFKTHFFRHKIKQTQSKYRL